MEANSNTPPAVTVIVPVYNTPAEKFRRCLESIVRQERVAGCLLVNDGFGSRRNTLKLFLFRHRLATPYLLLMAIQRRMGSK